MKKVLAVILLMVMLSLGANLAMAAPDPAFDEAEALVTVTVDEIIEWDDTVNGGNFDTIAITPNISAQADTPSASQSLVLYTNCDLDITADNTAAALLTKTTDTLVTEYKLDYDVEADGADTWGVPKDWALHNLFLAGGASTPSAVTHETLDGAIEVTLSARASNAAGTLADAGDYTATQTLTATF
jgi:hypothetical protein